jgi:hypothetical protein
MLRDRFGSALAMVAMAAILVPSLLTAQTTFQRTYGGASGDYGFSVQQTADGGYAIAGGTGSFSVGDFDVYLIKVNALGDTQWTRTYGGAGSQVAYSIQQTADGGYVLAGGTADSVFERGYLVRTDSGGETLWTRTFGPDSQEVQQVEQIRQTDDGGFVFVDRAYDYDLNVVSFVVRTDANGDSLWVRKFGAPDSGDYFAYSVQQTTDRGYIVSGKTSRGLGNYDSYLVKLDSVGGTMWTATFGDTGSQVGYWVEQTADGGYIMVGVTSYSDLSDGEDVYLVRADANGSALWSSVLRGANDQCGSEVHETSDGGYTLCGWTDLGMIDTLDAYLVHVDADGDALWARTFGGNAKDVGCSFQPTADGGYVVAGYTTSFGAGAEDVYVIKTDSLGNVGVAEPKAGPMLTRSLTLTCEPNPCRGATFLHLTTRPLDHSTALLRVYDASGCLVGSSSGIRASSLPLDLRGLPAGAYFIRCDVAGEHATTRVVLQR